MRIKVQIYAGVVTTSIADGTAQGVAAEAGSAGQAADAAVVGVVTGVDAFPMAICATGWAFFARKGITDACESEDAS